ncbi:hypothetical protein [Ktedonobacter sp. SOSP1-85]|uniref:hypothetical protein n=1 Tax=Ktedonobacter sp. SOSP1-85 TaxID=2778367 RepID=UPI001914DD2E|nr:hypothetical protein [Ktedonobacter sp. SOSP1-85]
MDATVTEALAAIPIGEANTMLDGLSHLLWRWRFHEVTLQVGIHIEQKGRIVHPEGALSGSPFPTVEALVIP